MILGCGVLRATINCMVEQFGLAMMPCDVAPIVQVSPFDVNVSVDESTVAAPRSG